MALRSIAVTQAVAADLDAVAPNARIFNYTNPVNIVAQALTAYTDIPTVSLCEGAIIFPHVLAESAGLDPTRLTATMVGINHNLWSTEHAYDARRDDPELDADHRRLMELALTMESVPSYYFLNYYFRDEILRRQRAAGRTQAEEIMAEVPDYWEHHREQGRRRRAGARPGPAAGRHPRARARDRRDERLLQRHRRRAAGEPAERRAGTARLRRGGGGGRGFDAGARTDSPAATAGTTARPWPPPRRR